MAARLFELWDAGSAVLPLSPSLADAEVKALLGEFKPQALEDASGTTELAGGVAVADGVAVVIATSGASGKPKGVELSHDALEWSARAY
ncbi:MAG: AMP-dependent synthetase, partial [Actinomycetota bacterium]